MICKGSVIRFWALLCALMPAVVWGQYFREPKLNLLQRQDIIYRSLQGDTTDLYKLRMVRYPKDLESGVDTVDFQAENGHVRLRLYRPKDNTSHLPLLVYMHGGCWMTGSLEDCEPFLGKICEQGQVAVLSVDYRWAPEYQFPEPMYDVVHALDFAYSNWDKLLIDTSHVVIGGEDAGANLAISALMVSPHKPKALMAINPIVAAYVDDGVSWSRYEKGFTLLGRTLELCLKAYLPDEIFEHDPLTSPIDAADYQLQRLPHTLIISSEYDILEDQGAQFYERLKKNNVSVQRKVHTGVSHTYLNNEENKYEQDITLRLVLEQMNL